MTRKNLLSLDEAVELIKKVSPIMWREEQEMFSQGDFRLTAEIWAMRLNIRSLGQHTHKHKGCKIDGKLQVGEYKFRKLFSYSGKSLEKLYDYVHDRYYESQGNVSEVREFLRSGNFSEKMVRKISNIR